MYFLECMEKNERKNKILLKVVHIMVTFFNLLIYMIYIDLLFVSKIK